MSRAAARPPWARQFRQVVLPLALVVSGGVLALGFKTSSDAMHPQPGAAETDLDDYPGLIPQEIAIKSQTGITLRGRFFAAKSGGGTVVLSHGYGGSQDEMLPVAHALHASGLNVLTYDARGSGSSPGEITFGTLEQQDLNSVVGYATGRADVDAAKIGALGFSMGAATTVMAAADNPRIKAVVADSGWSHVRSWLRPGLGEMVRNPTGRFTPLSLWFVERRSATRLDALNPSAVAGRLSPRPLLLIHGSDDDVVVPSDSDEVFAAAGEPKQLWTVPGARHGETLRPGAATSSRRVVEFFQQALGA